MIPQVSTEFTPIVQQGTQPTRSIYEEVYRRYRHEYIANVVRRGIRIEQEELTKRIEEMLRTISQALTRAAIELHLAKYVKDPKLKELLVKDEKLREIIAKSVYEIENYLNEMKIEHNIEVELWKDVEVDWTEIVINVKAKYNTHEEKMKIWGELCKILDKIDRERKLLVDISRL